MKFKAAISKTANSIKQIFRKKPRFEGDRIFNDKQKGLLDDYERLDIEIGVGLFRAETGLEERDGLLRYSPPLNIEVEVPVENIEVRIPVENTEDILEDTKIEVSVNNLTKPTEKKESKSLEALARTLPQLPTTALLNLEQRAASRANKTDKEQKNTRKRLPALV